jgi:hypothetical protein
VKPPPLLKPNRSGQCSAPRAGDCINVKAPRAVKAIATIHTAQAQCYSTYKPTPHRCRKLGPSTGRQIEFDLASGDKGGYKYTFTAAPTGTRDSETYFSDQGMGIHEHNGQEPATVNDPLMGETAPAVHTR